MLDGQSGDRTVKAPLEQPENCSGTDQPVKALGQYLSPSNKARPRSFYQWCGAREFGLKGIHRLFVDMQFVVQVGSSRKAGATDAADNLPLFDTLAHLDFLTKLGQVGV